MKVIGCILAAIGLGCIVKHVVMMYNGDIEECCCLQHMKNKDWSPIKKWKKEDTSSPLSEYEVKSEAETIKKSPLDEIINQYANGDITKEKFEELKKNLM